VKGGQPVTKAALATAVARQLGQFMEVSPLDCCISSTPNADTKQAAGYEQTSDPAWTIGPSAYRPEHVILLGLTNPCENVWQAEIAVAV
jgi:hypothetical protein